jgi:membrane-associated phospholipid phosphatase
LRNTRCGRGRRPRPAGFPALIAFSRKYVAAHYLSDVVVGAIVGALATFIAATFFAAANPPVTQRNSARPGFQFEI